MARIALYRKYRPSNFEELFGQDHIAITLKNAVRDGSFSHAYLFCGPRGTGKTSAARILAKAINCLEPKNGDPCNKCRNCVSINEGKAVDIIELDAASHTQVDNIREVIVERAKFAPTTLKYKVYIIDEAHMLSKSSFNALLKTLEEPPAHTIFILATTEVHKIIPTIQSRCQRFDFHRIDAVNMEKRLKEISEKEKIEIEPEALELIIRSSDGGFRDAISMLDKLRDVAKGAITASSAKTIIGSADTTALDVLISQTLQKKAPEALKSLEKALSEGNEPAVFSKNLLLRLRELTIMTINGEKLPAMEPKLGDLIEFTDLFVKNLEIYRSQPFESLPLEITIIKYCNDLTDIPAERIQHHEVQKSNSAKEERKSETKSVPTNLSNHAKWQQFLMEIKTKNNSINAVLKSCQPSFENEELILYFPYKFHKDRIEDHRNMEVVESVLAKVYGKQMPIKCILRPAVSNAPDNNTITKATKDDLLEDAIDIFGGEVIE